MSKSYTYTQVYLVKPFPEPTRGMQVVTVWIESKLAKKGKILKIKDWPNEGEWYDGWEVKEVYSSMEIKEVEAKSQDYKKQRKASGI